MPLQPIRFLVVCSMGLLALPGCKDEGVCLKSRNAASDVWKALGVSASKNKLTPTIGIDELPPEKKAPHVEAWGTIEKQAEMIASSFAYEKITWNTADPARQKANAAFEGYFAKQEFRSFEIQLKDANERYQAAEAACR